VCGVKSLRWKEEGFENQAAVLLKLGAMMIGKSANDDSRVVHIIMNVLYLVFSPGDLIRIIVDVNRSVTNQLQSLTLIFPLSK
jgi:hypothetical protein